MGFVQELTEKNIDIWQKCLDSEFVQNLGDGSLSRDDFMYYAVQDSIYLRKYASALGMGIAKAKNLKDVRTFYSLLAFINEEEGNTRMTYLKDGGYDIFTADASEENPVNKAYTDFMMECAENGDCADIMFCVLPCMLSYLWIFDRLVEQYPDSLNGYYGRLLKDFVSDFSRGMCDKWADFAEELSKDLSDEKKEKLADIFRQSSMHELNFWNMKKL